MEIDAFKTNLGVSELPAELEKLIEFQNERSNFEEYAQGFGLLIDDKSGISSWSEEPDFLERILPFAQANGSGSIYAFWKNDSSDDLIHCPILVFGDEGGVHVVAENFREFLRLLTYDTEISVDFDEAYFYKDEDYEASEDHDSYIHWLKENFNLDRVGDPETVITAAQNKHQAHFDQWFGLYYEG